LAGAFFATVAIMWCLRSLIPTSKCSGRNTPYSAQRLSHDRPVPQ
jgi:hypothetical protein